MKCRTNSESILGASIAANKDDFSDDIAFSDHKIGFAVQYCKGKKVLDIGCVQHDPENYKSKYWLHKALREVSASLVGIDLSKTGVDYLRARGFDVIYADAQQFDLGEEYDVIVAGDVVEHLEDFGGFLECCRRHMHAESRLIISTPNPWYWKNMLKALLSEEVSNNPEHTCWLCVRTLRQLLRRHELEIGEVVFGSRYWRDRLMPLPRGWKHTSFNVEIYRDA